MRIVATPLDLDEANALVAQLHRHLGPVRGFKFAIGAAVDDKVVGCVIVGRPVARERQDGWTLEVTRLASDGTPNVCSFLYGAACRAAFALGYRRVGTYTRKDEPGASLVAAGFRIIGEVKGRSWDTPTSGRPRVDKYPAQDRFSWERTA